jgi:hypothetical protein
VEFIDDGGVELVVGGNEVCDGVLERHFICRFYFSVTSGASSPSRCELKLRRLRATTGTSSQRRCTAVERARFVGHEDKTPVSCFLRIMVIFVLVVGRRR